MSENSTAILRISKLIEFGIPNSTGRIYSQRCVSDAIKSYFNKKEAIPVLAGEPTDDVETDSLNLIGFSTKDQILISSDCLDVDVTFASAEVANGVRDLILTENATFTIVGSGSIKENIVKHLKLQCFSVRATDQALQKIKDSGLNVENGK